MGQYRSLSIGPSVSALDTYRLVFRSSGERRCSGRKFHVGLCVDTRQSAAPAVYPALFLSWVRWFLYYLYYCSIISGAVNAALHLDASSDGHTPHQVEVLPERHERNLHV